MRGRPRAPGPLRHDRHERPAGDEVDQFAEERLAVVLGVVLLGGGLVQVRISRATMLQPLALDAADDLPDQTARTPPGLTRTRVRSLFGTIGEPTGPAP